ncbi:hypothetical protein [Chitinophaga sp. YIM B06452]|uniref:hypothetical protein n=1 Tax=Chitinophaga sp. YIM B06452 TaxID=3082158 RepID=UPI0031FEB243
MRPLLAICLFAALSMQFAARLSGYVQCMVTAYIVNRGDLAVDCECIRHLAASFGDDYSGNQHMQAKPQELKVQDYVPVTADVLLKPVLLPSRPVAGMLPSQYRYTGVSAIFHPPCKASLLFM